MIRGMAQPFKFKIPCNFSDLLDAKITFWQENYNGPDYTRPLPIHKVLSQCRQGNTSKELIVILNTEETLRFIDDRKAYVQLRASVIGGLPFGTKPTAITVYPVIDDSVLDDIVPTPTPDEDVFIFDGSTII